MNGYKSDGFPNIDACRYPVGCVTNEVALPIPSAPTVPTHKRCREERVSGYAAQETSQVRDFMWDSEGKGVCS
jgi:hypothetical protein